MSKIPVRLILFILSLAVVFLLVIYCWHTPIFRIDLPIDVARVSSFATLLSSIVGLIGLGVLWFQINETRKQIINSEKPNIFLLNREINFQNEDDCFVKAINVGRGVALDINYEWRYDKNYIENYCKKHGITVAIKGEDVVENKIELMRYEPTSEYKITLPKHLIVFFKYYYKEGNGITAENTIGEMVERLCNPSIKIIYRDIFSNQYPKDFEIRYSSDGLEITEHKK